LIVIVLAVVVVAIAAVLWFFLGRDPMETAEKVLTTTVFRGPYEHIVLEQGQVESSSNVEIRCEVKSRSGGGTEILWVRDEGTDLAKDKRGESKKDDEPNEDDSEEGSEPEKDDELEIDYESMEDDELIEAGVLVLLDSSALKQDLVQQEIVCNTSHALVVQAENTLRAAEIARIEYLEGTFKQEEQTIESEIFVAEENLRRAQLSFQSTERLAAKGIVTALQLEGDQFAVEKAKKELMSAQTKLKVLRDYTRQKTLKQFDSDIATAEAKWESEKKSHQLELDKLADIKEQLEKCVIFAPEHGQVVYANDRNRWGGSEFVVEPGATVRERQVIIRLPDPNKMQVKATINESRISLVGSGMPVAIEFDAIRDQTLRGEVTKVNQYSEPESWRSGNIKEYAAYIKIFNPPSEVRSGMNAEVRIYVEQLEDALQVPVQAICETKGHYFCLVKNGDDWETREVQVRSSNDTFMTIEAGLKEGDVVAMNPRAYPDKLTIPELPDEEIPEGEKGGSVGGNRPAGQSQERPGGKPASGLAGPGRAAGSKGADRAGGGHGGRFDPTKLFSMRDTDGDGTLSADELKAIPADRRGMLTAADADGDGAVTREEFTKAISRLKAGGAKRSASGGAGQ